MEGSLREAQHVASACAAMQLEQNLQVAMLQGAFNDHAADALEHVSAHVHWSCVCDLIPPITNK